jgi:hypothetical protein
VIEIIGNQIKLFREDLDSGRLSIEEEVEQAETLVLFLNKKEKISNDFKD